MRRVATRIRSSLRRRLTVLMAALVVCPALLSGLVLTLTARALLRREVETHMDAMAEAKADEIQSRTERWLSDQDVFTHRPLVRDYAYRLVTAPGAPVEAGKLAATLQSILWDLARPHGANFGDAVVVSLRTGRVVAWAGPGNQQQAQAHAAAYTLPDLAAHATPWLSPAYPDPDDSRPAVDVVQVLPAPAPASGPPVAALICQIPLDREIAPLLQQRQGMGETGEMVLVDPVGLALNDLRYEPNAVMKKVIQTEPVRLALAGKPGSAPLRDYRGRPVLAAYRQIPLTHWGLVVKMDLAEADTGVARLVGLGAGLTALLLVVGLLVALRTAAAVAQPVLDLSAAARRLAADDLSVRVHATRPDELGQLAQDFNLMATELAAHRHHLEHQIEEGTAELQIAGEQLREETADRHRAEMALEERTVELHLTGEQLRQETAERERAETALAGHAQELRSLAGQVSVAEERVREEVAADLHDTVLQQLALARIRLGLLKRSATSPADIAALDEMERLVQEGIGSGRAILRSLSPSGLHDQGLEHAVGLLAEQVQSRFGLTIQCEWGPDPVQLAEEGRVLLFQAARELLTNVVKHAQAQRATLSLRQEYRTVRLEVSDDGVGCEPGAVIQAPETEASFGLFSIRERLRHMGGSLELSSPLAGGCQVTVILPAASE